MCICINIQHSIAYTVAVSCCQREKPGSVQALLFSKPEGTSNDLYSAVCTQTQTALVFDLINSQATLLSFILCSHPLGRTHAKQHISFLEVKQRLGWLSYLGCQGDQYSFLYIWPRVIVNNPFILFHLLRAGVGMQGALAIETSPRIFTREYHEIFNLNYTLDNDCDSICSHIRPTHVYTYLLDFLQLD